MKKKLVIAVLFIVLLIILVCYLFFKSELEYGNYYAESRYSYLEIYEEGTFSFFPSIVMSQSYTGKYTIEGNTLVLASDNGTFKFRILKNKLKYIEGEGDFEGNLVEYGAIYNWKGDMQLDEVLRSLQ